MMSAGDANRLSNSVNDLEGAVEKVNTMIREAAREGHYSVKVDKDAIPVHLLYEVHKKARIMGFRTNWYSGCRDVVIDWKQ